MAVKLIPKSQLQEQKAKQQTREIEEGIKIAKRIDGLRETYSNVEQGLEKYRIATLQSIQEEINSFNTKKEILSEDVNLIQRKYDRMMQEISTKRIGIAQFEKSLKGWEKKLEEREKKVSLEEFDIMEAKNKAELSLSVQQDNERITANLLIQADKRRIEAQNTLETAKLIQEKAYSDKKDIEVTLVLREYSIKAQEEGNLKKSMELESKEKELNIEKIQVKDMKETLQRSLNRIRAGKLA